MHIWNPRQVCKIKDSLMGFAVASHQPGPVNGKDHRQILKTDIMKNLIICPLKKGGIYRYELEAAMDFAYAWDGPVAIRYPRGTACEQWKEQQAQ